MSPLGKFLLENCDNDLCFHSIAAIKDKANKAGMYVEIQDIKYMCLQFGITIKNNYSIKDKTLLGWLGSFVGGE